MLSIKQILGINYLTEGQALLPTEIPGEFNCCVKFGAAHISQFASRKLIGLEGITTERDVANGFLWLNGRNTILRMSGMEVAQSNRLSKALYDNLDYFFSNQLKNADRVIGDQDSADHVIFFQPLEQLAMNHKKEFDYMEFRSRLHEIVDLLSAEIRNPATKINNVNQFINWFVKTTQKLNPTIPITTLFKFDEVEKIIRNNVNFKNYDEEQEWILKDKVLNIPKHSTLMVYYNSPEQKIQFNELVTRANLENEYNVMLVPKI
jgi:hypothetical protein